MTSEADRVQAIMEAISEGKDVGQKLVYDKHTKTLRPSSPSKDPDSVISIRPSDLEMFTTHGRTRQ